MFEFSAPTLRAWKNHEQSYFASQKLYQRVLQSAILNDGW